MLYVGGLVAAAALVALVLLVRFLGRSGTPHTVRWTLLLVAAVVVALAFMNVTSVYYTPPVLWTTLTSGAVLAALVAFVLAARSLSWRGSRVLALSATLVLSLFLATVGLVALPTGRYLVPLFETRAQQIGAAHGFEALVAPDEQLVTDYLPVSTAGPDGLSLDYQRFILQERKADRALSRDDLEQLVSTGDDAGRIPDDARYEWFEVAGRPALGLEYREPGVLPKAQSLFRMLVFEKDGVEVRVASEGRNEFVGERDGEEIYEYAPPLTFEELVRIAESLQPKAD